MKKVLLFISSMLLSLNIVSADTTDIGLSGFYRDFDTFVSDFENTNSDYYTIYNKYISEYSDTYPYYYISYNDRYEITMFSSMPNTNLYYESNSIRSNLQEINILSYYQNSWHFNTFNNRVQFWNETNAYKASLVSSNIYFTFSSIPDSDTVYKLQVPPYSSSIHNMDFQYFEIEFGDFYPSLYSLYTGSYIPSVSYTEIDLNNYSYVALSLKNYNVSEPFSTNFIIKGQLCITPVYNYGMTEKSQYSGAGYQVESCSIPYDSFTPYQVYIIESDLTYHSIYYLKAYDTSIDNIVKVDTNIFNITYITSENANNPQVSIGGRSYPTIPYNNLTSSATTSTEEGYVSGQVKNVFDYSSDSDTLNTLFSNPLQALNTAFSAITIMFSLIGSFIAMLPSTLQAFLFVGFSVGICLGVIKILI